MGTCSACGQHKNLTLKASAHAPQVESGAHAALMRALWADTAFLAGQGVMDYSLLVGIDSPNGALVVGIIDFLRQVRRRMLRAILLLAASLSKSCWEGARVSGCAPKAGLYQ